MFLNVSFVRGRKVDFLKKKGGAALVWTRSHAFVTRASLRFSRLWFTFELSRKIDEKNEKNCNLAKRTKREKTPRKNSKKSYNGENESFFDQKS